MSIDIYSAAFQEDPFPAYQHLRRDAPVYQEPRYGAVVLTRHRDVDEALSLLGGGSSSHRTHDHVQYMLALAHALRDDVETAVEHLMRAIALNPNNRLQAKQEPDFDSIRGTQLFLNAVKGP